MCRRGLFRASICLALLVTGLVLPASTAAAAEVGSLPLRVVRGEHGSVVLSTRIPRAAGAQVILQRAGSSWAAVARTRADRRGAASFRLPGNRAGGTWRVVTRGVQARQVSRQVKIATPVEETGPHGSPDAFQLFDTGREGSVFRWDPCTPVRVYAALDGAPATLAADLHESLRQLAQATGLTFVDADSTVDADIAVTVASEAQSPQLAGASVANTTLSESRWSGVDARILRADVVIEREFVSGAPAGFDPGSPGTGLLLLHELGHAVGLAHTDAPDQVMYPVLTGEQGGGYQTGDRNGLARVGAGSGCLA